MRTSPAHVIGASFALSAFAVAILSGITAENAATTVLFRGLVVMGVCYPCGFIIGGVCNRVVTEHLTALAAKAQGPKVSGHGVETQGTESADSESETPIIV